MHASSLEDTPPLPNASGPDASRALFSLRLDAAFGPDANRALFSLRLRAALLLSAPAPPDLEASSQPAHRRKIDRQHQQSQGKHPEAEDRQEPQKPADAQRDADNDAQRTRCWNRHGETPEMKPRLSVGRIVI